MPYAIAEIIYASKRQICKKCREILYATPLDQSVDSDHLPFLMGLFQFHTEWAQKSANGVVHIIVRKTRNGTLCFYLVSRDGTRVDISFGHAIESLPSGLNRRQPQSLKDFKSAARQAIQEQVFAFRDQTLMRHSMCPIMGVALSRENCAVDHEYPQTFDQLLFDFCKAFHVNPSTVKIGSKDGTVACFEDSVLMGQWQSYHLQRAKLRLLSDTANLKQPKDRRDWDLLCKGLNYI